MSLIQKVVAQNMPVGAMTNKGVKKFVAGACSQVISQNNIEPNKHIAQRLVNFTVDSFEQKFSKAGKSFKKGALEMLKEQGLKPSLSFKKAMSNNTFLENLSAVVEESKIQKASIDENIKKSRAVINKLFGL